MTLPLHYWPVLSGEPLLPHFSAILRSGCHSAAIHGWQMVFDGMVSLCIIDCCMYRVFLAITSFGCDC